MAGRSQVIDIVGLFGFTCNRAGANVWLSVSCGCILPSREISRLTEKLTGSDRAESENSGVFFRTVPPVIGMRYCPGKWQRFGGRTLILNNSGVKNTVPPSGTVLEIGR